MKALLPITLAAVLVGQVHAQNTLHYWDFSTTADVVGGVPTSAVGSPDMSVHATYGEAYPGAGASLNTIIGGTGSGGGFLSADVHDGSSATALSFSASDNFAFSYWTYDDTTDGDSRGPRVMDCLSSTTEGFQLGTNAANVYNLRIDDDSGGSFLSNSTAAFGSLSLPADTWTHVVVNVSRTISTLEIFFDGVSQGTTSFTLSGIAPTQDLDIGVINGGTVVGQAQACGLDDLAFYDDVLGPADIAGLAAGTLTPNDLAPCPPLPSAEVVRLGTPPNPAALLPGVTSGPVVGAIWDPVIDHTTFMPGATLDFIAITVASTNNIPTGLGTILCDLVPAAIVTGSPGVPFVLPVGPNCNNVGVQLCAQGGSSDGIFVSLTNALDFTIGSF